MSKFIPFRLITYDEGKQNFVEFTINKELLDLFLDHNPSGIKGINFHLALVLREVLKAKSEGKDDSTKF